MCRETPGRSPPSLSTPAHHPGLPRRSLCPRPVAPVGWIGTAPYHRGCCPLGRAGDREAVAVVVVHGAAEFDVCNSGRGSGQVLVLVPLGWRRHAPWKRHGSWVNVTSSSTARTSAWRPCTLQRSRRTRSARRGRRPARANPPLEFTAGTRLSSKNCRPLRGAAPFSTRQAIPQMNNFMTERPRIVHHLTPVQVHRVVKQAAARAGIPTATSAHWLRHAHASHALDRDAPVSLVQATLGHASVATTGRYLHARLNDSSARYLPD
jgi:Phage integrase family